MCSYSTDFVIIVVNLYDMDEKFPALFIVLRVHVHFKFCQRTAAMMMS